MQPDFVFTINSMIELGSGPLHGAFFVGSVVRSGLDADVCTLKPILSDAAR